MKLNPLALLPSLLGALALLCPAGGAQASTNLLTSANIMVLQDHPTLVDTNDNINVRVVGKNPIRVENAGFLRQFLESFAA